MSDNPSIRRRGDIIKDFTLSNPPWLVHVEMEELLHRRHVSSLVGGAVMADPNLLESAMATASAIIVNRPFAAMSPNYLSKLLNDNSLTGVMLWACLRRDHQAISQSVAESLITEDNYWIVREAVLDLFGFKLKNDHAPAGTTTPPADPTQSTSGSSTADSAEEGSAPT